MPEHSKLPAQSPPRWLGVNPTQARIALFVPPRPPDYISPQYSIFQNNCGTDSGKSSSATTTTSVLPSETAGFRPQSITAALFSQTTSNATRVTQATSSTAGNHTPFQATGGEHHPAPISGQSTLPVFRPMPISSVFHSRSDSSSSWQIDPCACKMPDDEHDYISDSEMEIYYGDRDPRCGKFLLESDEECDEDENDLLEEEPEEYEAVDVLAADSQAANVSDQAQPSSPFARNIPGVGWANLHKSPPTKKTKISDACACDDDPSIKATKKRNAAADMKHRAYGKPRNLKLQVILNLILSNHRY